MNSKNLSDPIKKSLLQLAYSRYLQFFNTTIIIGFSFFIGIIIAFLTNQLDYQNVNHWILVGFISSIVFFFVLIFGNKFYTHLETMKEEVKKLKIVS